VDRRVIRPEDVLSGERKGVSFAMVTDTRPTDALRELVAGVDLLICEGTYGDDADLPKALQHKHMTFREAATLANDAQAGTLWLTHFGAGMACPEDWVHNARDAFPDVEIGRAGLTGQLIFEDGYRPGSVDSSISPDSTALI
jgi:ribonuclease Z